MTNQGRAQRGKDAEAPVRGAIDTSRQAPGALSEETIRTRAPLTVGHGRAQ